MKMDTDIVNVRYKEAGKNEDKDTYDELRTYSENYNELKIKEILENQGIKKNDFIDLASFHCAKGRQLDTSSGAYRTFKSDIKTKWLDSEMEKFNLEKNPLDSRNRIIVISQLCGFIGVKNCNTFLSRYARVAKLDPKDFSDFIWIYLINIIEKEGLPKDRRLLSLHDDLKNKNSVTEDSKSSKNTSVLLVEASNVEDSIAFEEYLRKNGVEFKNRHIDLKNYIEAYKTKHGLNSVYSALRLGDPCNKLEIYDESDRTFKQQSKNGIKQYEVYISKESYVQRNKIIEIGLLMLMSLDELNGFLKAVNMDPLYSKSKENKLIYYLSKELKDDKISSKRNLSERLEEDECSIFEVIDDELAEDDFYEVKIIDPRYFNWNNKTVLCFFDEQDYKYKMEVTDQNADTLMFIREGETLKIDKTNREKNKVLKVKCVL